MDGEQDRVQLGAEVQRRAHHRDGRLDQHHGERSGQAENRQRTDRGGLRSRTPRAHDEHDDTGDGPTQRGAQGGVTPQRHPDDDQPRQRQDADQGRGEGQAAAHEPSTAVT